jgi:hypothetical protein
MGKLFTIVAAALFIIASIAPVGAQTANRNQTTTPTKATSASDSANPDIRIMTVESIPVMFDAGKASSSASTGGTKVPISGNDMNWLQGGGG